MQSGTHTVSLTLHIKPLEGADTDELDRITRDLMSGLEELNIESATPLYSGPARPGEKGPDLVTWGALGVVVLQAALPKVLEFIQAWSLRDQCQSVKIKAQRGDRSIEVEYPKTLTPQEAKEHIEMVLNTLGKPGKGH